MSTAGWLKAEVVTKMAPLIPVDPREEGAHRPGGAARHHARHHGRHAQRRQSKLVPFASYTTLMGTARGVEPQSPAL